jgi:hypothetical protein
MASQNDAKRDGNFVTSVLFVGSDGLTYPVQGDETTGRLKVDASGSASGDVTGPASSTDNAIVRFDGTTGKAIQNSGVLIDDSNVMSITTVKALTAGGLTIQTNGGTNAVLIGGGGSANFTSYGNTLLNAETASRAVYLDASKVLKSSVTTSTELGYLSGVTSAIQTQLDAKQATITGAATTIVSSDLTVNRALISNGSGKVAVSDVTSTELGYLDGVTSAIQTQLDDKIEADSIDTLTNKTFDANGTGNSLSNVDVSDLADGTDGELITWDATGSPDTVAAGTSGQVLTSNGAGAAPTFQDASGGGGVEVAVLYYNDTFGTGSAAAIEFNEVQYNGITGSSLSSGAFTLPVGTYLFDVVTTAYDNNVGESYIRDTSDSSVLLTSTVSVSDTSDPSISTNHIKGVIEVVGSSKSVELYTTDATYFIAPYIKAAAIITKIA